MLYLCFVSGPAMSQYLYLGYPGFFCFVFLFFFFLLANLFPIPLGDRERVSEGLHDAKLPVHHGKQAFFHSILLVLIKEYVYSEKTSLCLLSFKQTATKNIQFIENHCRQF